MDLDVINTVLAVAQTKSFSAAAYIIPCAQSSVSRRVEAAEAELNVKIFTRPADSADRGVHLTKAGEQLVPILERIMSSYRELFSVAAEAGKFDSALRIGVRSNLMPPMAFPALKADFYEKYPEISVEMQFGSLDQHLSELKSRKLDAILFSCIEIIPEEFKLSELFRLRLLGKVPLSLGVSEKNPLAKLDCVHMADLQNETMLMKEITPEKIPGIIFTDVMDFYKKVEETHGFTPKVKLMTDHMLEVRYQLAKNNKGVFPSFTPKRWRDMPGVKYIPFDEAEDRQLSYYLLSQKTDDKKELKLFADFISSALDSND